MIVKLLDSFAVCIDMTAKRHRNFLVKSSMMLRKRQFCSKNDENNPPEKLSVKKLLNISSPLRASEDDDLWATSAYPQGTVFRDTKFDDDEDKINPASNPDRAIILFPGQGNQFVGMAKNLLKYPIAVDMFKMANEILGYNLLKICLEGPEDVLNDTLHCQPATFVCSLALLEKVKEERPWAISNCLGTCGYSLGELSALVFAGCVNFEDGLRLVKKRSKAMAECCKNVAGGMLTIITGPRAKLSTVLSDAREHCKSQGIEKPECIVASYLFPNCKVIAGNEEALRFIQDNAKKYFIGRCSRLPVSGAFHTALMKDAAKPFQEVLENIRLKEPIVRVYSNVTGKPYKNAAHIKKILPKQIYRPVRWEQTMQHILTVPKHLSLPHMYECGPGNSLTVIAKKVNALVYSRSTSMKL